MIDITKNHWKLIAGFWTSNFMDFSGLYCDERKSRSFNCPYCGSVLKDRNKYQGIISKNNSGLDFDVEEYKHLDCNKLFRVLRNHY